MKISLILFFNLSILFSSFAQPKDPKMKGFIDQLMSKMTIEEKIGQLNLSSPPGDIITGSLVSKDAEKLISEGKIGAVLNMTTLERIRKTQEIAVTKSRLKIPLIFGLDVIHGYKTEFPIPLGLSASWDLEAIKKSAQIAAKETSADGINWTFSPMVDITRDPRWGRVAEGAGEDPFLGSQIAKAMVKGYQGDDFSKNTSILACVKHFALYGGAEAGRDYNTVDMSKIRMYNEYFPPYKAAIDAGAATVMTSFNEIDGIPATGNKWLLTDVLRKQWKFDGFVVTDYTSLKEMTAHGMGNSQEVSALALKAGTDMDMVGEDFLSTLRKSLDEGKITKNDIDAACRRILEMKYKLGLFTNPFKYINEERQKTEIFTTENRNVAREVASKTFVLLKNNNNILPLKNSGTVAVIGALATDKSNMIGTWAVATDSQKAIPLMQGLTEFSGPKPNIIYARGSNITDDMVFAENSWLTKDQAEHFAARNPKEMLEEAVETAKKADVVVLTIGEGCEMTGECSSRTQITIPESQITLLNALKETGKPIVLVLFTGRPLDLTNVIDKADAILNVWFPGSEAGYAITDALFGKVNPSGKLSITFPRSVGQVPIYYNHKNTGRPLGNNEGKFEKFRSNYLDERNEPLFPFGFGLSYTTFSYSDMQISATKLKGNTTLKATVNVSNTGNYNGEEIVQLYIRDLVGSVTRPVKELKGFQKIFLKAGESKKVTFEISPAQLKFYNSNLQLDWESGDFEIMIGKSSDDVISKTINWQK